MQRNDDQELLAGLRRGDPAAFATFVRDTQREVWRLVAHLADPQSADDLTQETYIRALRALPAFRAESSLRTWLLAIARRVVADELRGRGRRRRVDDAATRARAEGIPDHGGGVVLRALITGLEPARREAFVLTQMLGLSYSDTAQIAGVPIGTIRSRVARARDDLITAINLRESGRAG